MFPSASCRPLKSRSCAWCTCLIAMLAGRKRKSIFGSLSAGCFYRRQYRDRRSLSADQRRRWVCCRDSSVAQYGFAAQNSFGEIQKVVGDQRIILMPEFDFKIKPEAAPGASTSRARSTLVIKSNKEIRNMRLTKKMSEVATAELLEILTRSCCITQYKPLK